MEIGDRGLRLGKARVGEVGRLIYLGLLHREMAGAPTQPGPRGLGPGLAQHSPGGCGLGGVAWLGFAWHPEACSMRGGGHLLGLA